MIRLLRKHAIAALLALCAAPAGVAQTAPPSAASAPGTLSAEEYERRKALIVGYFEKKRARHDVVATTRTKSGQVIDWIRPKSQVEGGRIATAPGELKSDAPKDRVDNPYLDTGLPTALKSARQVEAKAATELQLDASARGPAGTVPIVRFDLESYLREVKDLPDDPLKILSKVPPPDPASNDRYYAVWHRFGDVSARSGGSISGIRRARSATRR